jgi:hypothetical protein
MIAMMQMMRSMFSDDKDTDEAKAGDKKKKKSFIPKEMMMAILFSQMSQPSNGSKQDSNSAKNLAATAMMMGNFEF